MEFQQQQYGRFFSVLMVGLILFLLYLTYALKGFDPENEKFLVAYTIVFSLLLLLFYKLKMQVSNSSITLSYGVGLIRKKIDLASIEKVEAVRNKWWYGWGIRKIPNAWLWSIEGLDAVEITYRDTDKKFRIGCADGKSLQRELEKRMKRV